MALESVGYLGHGFLCLEQTQVIGVTSCIVNKDVNVISPEQTF